MKKILIVMAFILAICGFAHAEYWENSPDQTVPCCDDRPGCQVLQTVMMGSFAGFDPDDSLSVRVLSAALPRLTAVTEDDFIHFSEMFDEDMANVKELYYTALGNCLRADIIVSPLADSIDEQNARSVLSLFLDPEEENAAEQMEAIRENCTEDTFRLLAENVDVPAEFVEYIIAGNAGD